MRRYCKTLYLIAAALWTLMCLYGIYDTAINPTHPEAYDLSRTQMGFGFALVALLAWIPLLIVTLRRNNPKTATLEQTLERVNRELYQETHDQPRRRTVATDDDDDTDQPHEGNPRAPF